MKTFRDQLQWQELILAQQQSGLNISTYVSAQLPSEAAKYLGSAPQPMASNLTSPPRLDVEATL